MKKCIHKNIFEIIAPIAVYLLISPAGLAQREMEYLDRGVIAVPSGKHVFISWRLLGTEPYKTSFDLYRTVGGSTKKLNNKPIATSTNFTDSATDLVQAETYAVVAAGKPYKNSKTNIFTLPGQANPYLSIKL